MGVVLNYVLGILLCSAIPILAILNIVRFVMWLKCRNTEQCTNSKCWYHTCCPKFQDEFAEKQPEDLYTLIKKYKKELKEK